MEWFKAYASWKNALELLSDEQAGRLMKAIWHYASCGEVTPMTGVEGMAFAMILPQMQKDEAAHDAFVESRRINGAKGGRPKKASGSEEEPKKPSGFSENLQKPTETYDNLQNQYKKEEIRNKKEEIRNKKKEIEEPKRKRFTAPTVDDVKAFCTEKGLSVDAEHFVAYYESNGWRVGKNPMRDWQAAVRIWSRNEYSSNKPQAPAKVLNAQNYTQRNYSDEEMNRLANRAWLEEI